LNDHADDLRFMDALDRAGSLSAAARSLNVTPPALSMRLKKLERLLNINLVVRSPRHVRFTSEGERLVAEARSLLEQINAMPDALAGEGRSLAGRLHVVSSFGFGRIHRRSADRPIAAAYPSVRVTLDLSERPWTESKNADVVIHIGTVRDFVVGGASAGQKRAVAVCEPGLPSPARRAVPPARPAGAHLPVRARERRGCDLVALSQ
jgi:DNA-binding transcriptional LysR family regulator